MEATRPKVIVIGAGISGLIAASTLQKSGQVDVCVLEASERIGGRIHSTKFGNERVELGAGWLHGEENNPLYKLAKENDIPLTTGFNCTATEYNKLKLYSLQKSKRPTSDVINEVYAIFEELVEDVCKEISVVGKASEYSSVGEYVEQGFEVYLKENPKDSAVKRSVFEWFVRNECHTCGVNSLKSVDIKSNSEYKVDENNSYILPRGYKNLLDCLFADLNPELIHLNHEVQKIKWSNERTEQVHPVSILCDNGNAFQADHVIVTVPLGVLKSRHKILFEPILPENKVNAIQCLGFGTINRIFLEFERPFWSTEHEGMGLLWPVGPLSNEWPSWVKDLYLFYPHSKESNILITWLSGEAAIEMENKSEEEIGVECIKVLKYFIGISNLPALLQVVKTCWNGNKLSRGCYTYVAENSCGSDIDTLATPVPNYERNAKYGSHPLQILFAGEATSRNSYATTQGAYISGVREAKRILDNLKLNTRN